MKDNQLVKVEQEIILKKHAQSDDIGKKLLEELFGKELFKYSYDWIELWNKFCKENDIEVILPHNNPRTSDEQSDNAYVMLRTIIKIRNIGWVPDWNDDNEYKYYPYFDMRSSPGFQFSSSHSNGWAASTHICSRLCSKSLKLAESITIEFLPIYEKFMK